jgi:outer membrane protein OmpA-like peptidoglycan-associated protein
MLASAILMFGLVGGANGFADGAPPAVPLCQGLTIVTAVNQFDGDYESIKTIESVTSADVRLRYSVERLVVDMFGIAPSKVEQFTLHRTVRQADLKSAFLYQLQFSTELPEAMPETTAIGTSAAVLNDLKTKGQTKFGIFIPYSQIKPPIDRNVHPNVYDNQMVATITRVGAAPVMLPVILNDMPVTLPTIQADGDFFGDKSEFFFLDNPDNPLTLMFRIGIDAFKPQPPDVLKMCESAKKNLKPVQLAGGPCDKPNGGDRDVLRVVKITDRCAAPVGTPSGNAGAGSGAFPGPGAVAAAAGASGGANALERALLDTGKVDIYSIYFSFNSDVIRAESEATLKDIEEVLRRHPAWRLTVNGHTDGIGSDQFNVDLSRRRSAAVKDALVKKHGVDGARLLTSGFGKSQPKDTNDTIEGRAHNRRVELIRQS